jgi:multicomponent Na+:H+ antiporter subunit F
MNNILISDVIIFIAFALLLAALAISLLRLVIGPSINDRIAAMDLIASLTMGFILLYSALVNKALYFDIAIVISLISFIGTVAISTYLKKKR